MPALLDVEEGLDIEGGVVLVFTTFALDDVLIVGADVDYGLFNSAIDFFDDG